jgi:hypothetical protein
VKGDAQPISDGLELFYTVTVEKDNPTFHVSIKVENLNPGELIFRFFTVRANLEQYISNLQARDQTKTLAVVYLGDFRWKVYQNGGTLFIDYDVSKIIPSQSPSSRDIGQKEFGVYIDNEGGIFWAQYVFMVPESDTAGIKIKFSLPSGWQLVTPYVEHEGYYEVPKITNFIDCDFVKRPIYFGKMKFYAESKTGNCTVKFGVLEEDQSNESRLWLAKEEGVKFYTDRVVLALNELTKMFGENPFPVFPVTIRFMSRDEWYYMPYIFGEVQYWPPERYDETLGHLYYSWMMDTFDAPTGSNYLICKGIGESYLGNKLAYKITGDKAYLGKIYHYYLVYKGAQNTKYSSRYEIHDEYYRGCVVGLWLDNLIQKETGGKNSIEDVIGYLYQKYKNTGHEISNKDLEEATDLITKQNNSALYKKYVDGDEDIPVDEYIQPYKDGFNEFIKVLDSDNWMNNDYRNYTIPFFVNVEMAIRSPIDLPMGILILSHYRDFAKYVLENYNIDTITKEDVETSLSKLTGEDCTGFFERWKDSYGELSLEAMKEWLKSYLPYTTKNLQAAFENNSVTLGWDQVEWRYPSGYYLITGYAIYRGTSPGEEVLIATVPSNSYTDTDIEPGKTYYYYVKSIENLFEEIPVYSDPSSDVTVICKDTSPPEIFIYSPSDNFKTNENTITVSGTILDKESGIDKVTVNGVEFSLSSDGSFNTTVNLTEGVSKITVIAIDKAGNQTTKTLNVTYEKPVQTIIILRIGQTSFTVNGDTETLDSPPIVKNSRTLLPIRVIIKSLGGTVSWDATERKVTVSLGSTTIELWIGKSIAKVNGIDTSIDSTNSKVVPEIINGRTMLPLRFVTEQLGATVKWEPTTKTITITYKK